MKKQVGIFLSILLICCLAIIVSIYRHNTKGVSPLLSCIDSLVCSDCNVILLSVDSLRADHLMAYGYRRETAPHFSELTKSGYLFANYFSSSYLTPISEMAVHTGMYASANGVVDFNSFLPERYTTLAQILKNEGYTTSALMTSPEFSTFEALKDNFSRGFDSYRLLKTYSSPNEQKKGVQANLESKEDELVKELDKLQQKKFFLWLPIGTVHWPYGYRAHNRFDQKNYSGLLPDLFPNWHETYNRIYNNTLYPEGKPLPADDTRYLNDMYDSGIWEFDTYLGVLINELKQRDLLKKTILVLQSEHGEGLLEDGYIAHYDIRNTQIHTPFFIRLPQEKSSIVKNMAGGVDILPTVLGLIGRAAPSQVQGQSRVPDMCGYERSPEENVAFSERVPLWEEGPIAKDLIDLGVTIPEEKHKDIAIQTPEWKLIYRSSREHLPSLFWWGVKYGVPVPAIPELELYHIATDPYERKNVADDNPIIVEGLMRSIVEWGRTVQPIPDQRRSPYLQYYF